jgi:hypothetical protein
MTLICDRCGSHDLRITAQSYNGDDAFEGYECGNCGATGSLTHDRTGTTLLGCLGSDRL